MLNGKKLSIVIIILFVSVFIVGGCVNQMQYDDLKAQNRIQQDRLATLEADLNAAQIRLQQVYGQLETTQFESSANIGAKGSEIEALEKDIADKKILIAKMQEQLLRSGVQLPVELTMKLQELAQKNEMVSFDESTGMLRFKSDLLFNSGSDQVQRGAVSSIKSLCSIMNVPEAKDFDIVIVGHTDDVPIGKPATRAKHPTNWHLSVHRAISVLNLMTKNAIASQRVSVKGFGQYRPVEENKPKKKGNPANRRVEIFVVPSASTK
jgi:chemotaxis protein MotB